MQAILSVIAPFFALVLAGYLAARLRLLPLDAVPGMNVFVLYVALPALMFDLGSQLSLSRLIDPVVVAIYLSGSLTLVAFSVAITLSRRIGIQSAAFGALATAFPNSALLGLPLLTALLGQAAAAPVMTTLLVDLFITSTLCVILAQAQQYQPPLPFEDSLLERESQPAPSCQTPLLRTLLTTLLNPLPWAAVGGAVMTGLGLELLEPARHGVDLLANAASPIALFTVGAMMWRSRAVPSTEPHQPGHSAPELKSGRRLLSESQLLLRELPMGLVKLLLHPLLILVIGLAIRDLGAPINSSTLMALVLTAALPAATQVSTLAQRYGADTGRVGRIVLVSTSLSFLTFTLIASGLASPSGASTPASPGAPRRLPDNIDIRVTHRVTQSLKSPFEHQPPAAAMCRNSEPQFQFTFTTDQFLDEPQRHDVASVDRIWNPSKQFQNLLDRVRGAL